MLHPPYSYTDVNLGTQISNNFLREPVSRSRDFLVGSGSGNTICVLVLFTTLPRLIAQESSNTDARQFLDPDPA